MESELPNFILAPAFTQPLIHLDEVADNISALFHGFVDCSLLLQEIRPEDLVVDLLRSVLCYRGETPGKEDHLEQPVEREVPGIEDISRSMMGGSRILHFQGMRSSIPETDVVHHELDMPLLTRRFHQQRNPRS